MKFGRKNRYQNITIDDIEKYLSDYSKDPAVETYVKKPNIKVDNTEVSRIKDKFNLGPGVAERVTAFYYPEYEDKLESLEYEVECVLSAALWYKEKKQ